MSMRVMPTYGIFEQVSNLCQAILQNISLFYLWPKVDDERGHLEGRKMEECHFFLFEITWW